VEGRRPERGHQAGPVAGAVALGLMLLSSRLCRTGDAGQCGGLVAPKFQLVNEQTVLSFVNFMYTTVSSGVGDVKADYTEILAKAADANALVDEVVLLLAGGQFPPTWSPPSVQLWRASACPSLMAPSTALGGGWCRQGTPDHRQATDRWHQHARRYWPWPAAANDIGQSICRDPGELVRYQRRQTDHGAAQFGSMESFVMEPRLPLGCPTGN
jgi:hypothetical protein